METKIVKLLESSIVLAARCSTNRTNGSNNAEIKSQLAEALNKAKDASSLDRILHHEQDKQGENVFHNFDLTYAVRTISMADKAYTIYYTILLYYIYSLFKEHLCRNLFFALFFNYIPSLLIAITFNVKITITFYFN